jgi:hypothetical protein
MRVLSHTIAGSLSLQIGNYEIPLEMKHLPAGILVGSLHVILTLTTSTQSLKMLIQSTSWRMPHTDTA